MTITRGDPDINATFLPRAPHQKRGFFKIGGQREWLTAKPKSEYRNPKQARNSKSSNQVLRLMPSDFGLVSIFVLRISDLSPQVAWQLRGKKLARWAVD